MHHTNQHHQDHHFWSTVYEPQLLYIKSRIPLCLKLLCQNYGPQNQS